MGILGDEGWARTEAALDQEGDASPDLSRVLRHRPAQRRSRRSVRKIIQAADALLPELGYAAITAAPWPIVERAGVTAGVFYHYFENGAAVLEALSLVYFDQARIMIDRLAGRSFADWESALDAVTDTFASFYSEPSVHELWLNDRLRETAGEVSERINGYIADTIARVLEEVSGGELLLRPPALQILRTLGDDLLHYAFSRPPEETDDYLTEVKIAMRSYCRTMLGGPDAALRRASAPGRMTLTP
ncbi:TetR family transcriptional regulator [Spirillospora sp. NPDC046719]